MSRWSAGATLLLALLAAVATTPLLAQAVAVTPRGSIIVAHDGVVELFDDSGRNRIWRANGVASAEAIVTGEKQAAVLDAFANRAAIVDLDNGSSTIVATGETPIGGVFAGGDLYVLDRDARAVERVAAGGTRAAIGVAADPAFIRAANGKLFVYSRTAGALQEITVAPFAVSRSTAIAPFASDLEVDQRAAYLVYPAGQLSFDASRFLRGGGVRPTGARTAQGLIRTVDLASMQPASEVPVGSGPVDLALAAVPMGMTGRIAVADPSAKRVWMIEGEQSVAQAFARGFVRGLLGVDLFRATQARFETGVDRVLMARNSSGPRMAGNNWVAYDSSNGTLYRFSRNTSKVLARGVAPNAFALLPDGVAWWQDGTLVARRDSQ
jgi:hypothetical protein